MLTFRLTEAEDGLLERLRKRLGLANKADVIREAVDRLLAAEEGPPPDQTTAQKRPRKT